MTTRSKLTLVVSLGMIVFGTLTFLIGLLLGLSSPPPMAAYPPALATAPGGAAPDVQADTAMQPGLDQAAPAATASVPVTVPVTAGAAGTGNGATGSTAIAYAPLPPAAPERAPAGKPIQSAVSRTAPGAPMRLTEPPGHPVPAPVPVARKPEPVPRAPAQQVASIPEPLAPETLVQVVGRSVPEPVHAVQVGRFLSRPSAEALAVDLIAHGYDARVVAARSLGVPTRAEWYLVTIGPQPDRPTADRVAREVSAAMGVPAQPLSWAGNDR